MHSQKACSLLLSWKHCTFSQHRARADEAPVQQRATHKGLPVPMIVKGSPAFCAR